MEQINKQITRITNLVDTRKYLMDSIPFVRYQYNTLFLTELNNLKKLIPAGTAIDKKNYLLNQVMDIYHVQQLFDSGIDCIKLDLNNIKSMLVADS